MYSFSAESSRIPILNAVIQPNVETEIVPFSFRSVTLICCALLYCCSWSLTGVGFLSRRFDRRREELHDFHHAKQNCQVKKAHLCTPKQLPAANTAQLRVRSPPQKPSAFFLPAVRLVRVGLGSIGCSEDRFVQQAPLCLWPGRRRKACVCVWEVGLFCSELRKDP